MVRVQTTMEWKTLWESCSRGRQLKEDSLELIRNVGGNRKTLFTERLGMAKVTDSDVYPLNSSSIKHLMKYFKVTFILRIKYGEPDLSPPISRKLVLPQHLKPAVGNILWWITIDATA